jgi:mannose/fructose/N-acetylgalactosamine-specific phosphotransferase system component IIB
MEIRVFRIDDRLIHGQIVTAWLQHSGADQIVVADDQASRDAFQTSLLQMATPPGVKLSVLPLDEAIVYLTSTDDTGKVLLLARGPAQALQIAEGGVPLTEINVGNLNMKPGKQKILNEMWLDQADVDALKALAARGIVLEQRVVPSDRRQDTIQLISRFKA